MSNVIYKNVRKLKNGSFQVEFVDAQGVTKKEVCHDPLSCREHAGLFTPLAAGLGTILKNAEELDEADDSNATSLQDYVSHTEGTLVEVNTPKCMHCGKASVLSVPEAGLEAYKAGALLQDAFPDMAIDNRELFKTGTHPQCWIEMFGTDEDED
jgi:hypothetical protein